MNSMPAKWTKRDFLTAIIFLQLIVYVTVFFDIPIARQVLGFFYLTFLPGFVILKLLKLDEFDWVETVLFSIGFSVAFLMLVGLFANEFVFALGFSELLSLLPLIIIFNAFVFVVGVVACLRSENIRFRK